MSLVIVRTTCESFVTERGTIVPLSFFFIFERRRRIRPYSGGFRRVLTNVEPDGGFDYIIFISELDLDAEVCEMGRTFGEVGVSEDKWQVLGLGEVAEAWANMPAQHKRRKPVSCRDLVKGGSQWCYLLAS